MRLAQEGAGGGDDEGADGDEGEDLRCRPREGPRVAKCAEEDGLSPRHFLVTSWTFPRREEDGLSPDARLVR